MKLTRTVRSFQQTEVFELRLENMVLKQCHSRLKTVVLNHPENKLCETSALNRNIVTPSVSTLTTVNASHCFQRCTEALEEQRRRRGAAGPKSCRRSAGVHTSMRGNLTTANPDS